MDLKELVSDDQAVSPVIGVILMVAITVILAAVIGTFVLGLGGQLSKSAPTASFQFDYNKNVTNATLPINDKPDTWNDTLTISHAGGDTIPASAVTVKSDTGFIIGGTDSPGTVNKSKTWAEMAPGKEVSAGDTAKAEALDLTSATFRVVWNAAEGDSSAVLGKWSGPDAS